MEVRETALEGVVMIEPTIHGDERGYFYESFSAREFAEKVRPGLVFVQDNQSYSSYGVLRGLHFQSPPYSQSKIVRVIQGCVRDVAVDLRWGSPTYAQYVAIELSGENHRQLFIPAGFAHGLAVLSPTALVQYKCDQLYVPEAEQGLSWNDPDLSIDWGVPHEAVILSSKDQQHGKLCDFTTPFVYGEY